MSISIDTAGLERAKELLQHIPKGTEKAILRSLNRSIVAARTAASKEIRQNYVIKAGTVKKHMRLKKASYSNLSASLISEGSPIDLMQFKVKVKKKGTIFATVKRGAGGPLPHSFFVTTKSPGLFHRKEKTRLPIQREFGPSVPQMMGNENVVDGIKDRAADVFNRTLEHEIYRQLSGYGGGK